MHLDAREFALKDGRKAVLRSLCGDDAADMLSALKAVYGESDFLSRYPEEFTLDLDQEKAWLEKSEADPASLNLGAFVDGELAGTCEISRIGSSIKTAHRAELAISVLSRFQGLGIANAMMETLIALAPSLGFSQIELEVVSTNMKALSLYRKYGFKECGTVPAAFRLKDGRQLDLTMMVRTL